MRHAIAAAVLLAAPGGALADDSWEETATNEMGYAALAMSADGWTLRNQYDARALAGGQTDSVPVRLGNRNEYAIVALCDENCGDVDLALYGAEDALLADDCAEAGLAQVHVTPTERALYDLEVRMIECAEGTACNYSVAVFSRPGRIAVGQR
jgi:hypothetical protein